MRIDECRSFLGRAQTRGKDAAIAFQAAEEAVLAATTEIDRATAELQELEAERKENLTTSKLPSYIIIEI